MKGIEITDEKLKKIEMDTFTKLINKNTMILHHTDPTNILNTLLIKDANHFYLDSKYSYKMITLENANTYDSTWYDLTLHKNAINKEYLKSFFYTYAYKFVNFNQLKEKFQNVIHKDKEETNDLEFIG